MTMRYQSISDKQAQSAGVHAIKLEGGDMDMVIGQNYNWKHQPERLVYIGKEGAWHQFALTDSPNMVWCEVLDTDLKFIEVSDDN